MRVDRRLGFFRFLVNRSREDVLVDWIELATKIGFFPALVVFFIWYARLREERLSQRITTLEDEHRNIIVKLVEQSTAALTENTVVMRRLEQYLEMSRAAEIRDRIVGGHQP